MKKKKQITPKQQLTAAEERQKRRWFQKNSSPDMLSFTDLDPLTQQTLIADLVRDTKNQPDPSTAVEMTDDDAVVSWKWPGINAPVSVGRDGEFLLTGLVRRLVFELVPPIHDKKRPEKKRPEKLRATKAQVTLALRELARDHNWTIAQAKRHVILGALFDAVEFYGKRQWRRRIGKTRKGNKFVSVIPDDAGIIGYLKWLQQVVPEYARAELLHDLQPDPPEEGDWPTNATTGKPREFSRSLFSDPNEEESEEGEPSGADRYELRLAQGVVTFRKRKRELLVFLADMPPQRFSFAERLCEYAGLTLSDEQHRILNTDCDSDQEIEAATGIPAKQVPVYGEGYAKTLMGEIDEPRKAWKKLLRG